MQKIKPLLSAIMLLISLAQTDLTQAHAVVMESTLEVAPISAQTATTIALQFNSRIELALSRIFLVSEGDALTKLKTRHGSKPGEILMDIPPLAHGEYALKLKVFAADGHLTEDIIHFSVTQ